MAMTSAIFKIGGTILDNSKNLINTIAQLTQLFEDEIIKKIILVPGGGLLVDFIRHLYKKFHFNDDITHWMAIYAMDYNGKELKRKFPHLKINNDLKNLEKENRLISIFLPYNYLKEKDELPHSWDVTSDSITFYLAKTLGMNECFLIKDIQGIYDSNQNIIKKITTKDFKQFKLEGKLKEIDSTDLELKIKTKPIDPYLLTLIDCYKIPCIILNGVSPSSDIFKYFTSNNIREKNFTKLTSI
ncbi:MAG: hypothetical protein ACFE9I_12005 [Candidatus Hermodarchaeota archaeon]